MRMLKRSLLTVSAVLLCLQAPAFADVAIIVSQSTPISSLSADQVKAIFLKRSNSFPDGNDAIAIDLPQDNPVRDEFYLLAVHKKSGQMRAYWAKRIFTGKGTPNEIMRSEAAIKKWVASNAGHIGYISAAAVDDSVKVLLRLP